MKVMLEIDPQVFWRIQTEAERIGVKSSQMVADVLTARFMARGTPVEEQIAEMHASGACDADMAGELDMTSSAVAYIRRRLGLPAHPRYKSRKRAA